MRTFSTIEGLPVLGVSTGREYGHILDLLYENGCVTGFLIDQKGWFNKHLFLPVTSVSSFGQDGMMVKGSYVLKPYSKTEKKAFPLKSGKRRLQGTPLLTKEGEKLGLMEDVYFTEEVGTIVGYIVTDGLIADLLEGRKVINSQAGLVIGGGRAILTE